MPHAYHVLLGGIGNRIDEFLLAILIGQGYRVETAIGREAVITSLDPLVDLVLLDLPSPAELPYLVEIRSACTSGLIVIGPSRNERLLIAALEHGADDYVQRPFRTDELLARMRAQLRRRPRISAIPLEIDRWTIDLAAQQVRRDGQLLLLGNEEYRLLAVLAVQPGFCYAVDHLSEQLWGRQAHFAGDRLAHVVEQLRRQLGDEAATSRLIGGDLQRGYWLGTLQYTRSISSSDT